ncbi:MAG: aquaporin [Calditrichia bacterium]
MKIPKQLFFYEFLGTALLILFGLSFVILDFGAGSPVVRWIPDAGIRRLITGFLFGSTGGLIAVSAIGKHSGAHINPVVSLAFWMRGKMSAGHAIGYILAQLLGGIVGAVPLLFWGKIGASVQYGATFPGSGYGAWLAVLGEVATTFCLIVGLFFFISNKRIRAFTPMLFPFLYAVMVFLEAPVSGTSTNPARSLGPAVVAWDWQAWWVYWVGPVLGTLVAIAAHKLRLLGELEFEVAKLYHFEHDPFHVFKRDLKIEEENL